MSKPPAFQFYADDFLAGTFTMTLEERGLYITLLCRQWTQGHVTPDEVSRLGSTAVQPAVNHVLTKFQPDENGNLKNARLEAERGKQNAFRALQAAKGRASAEARLNRGSTAVQPSGEPKGQPKPNSPSPSPSPSNTPCSPPAGDGAGGDGKADDQTEAPGGKGPLQLRAEALMRRRPTTPLHPKEKRAFQRARPSIKATSEEDWTALEAYYAAKMSPDEDIRRKALEQLLNNWNGEIDRARAWLAKNEPVAETQSTRIAV